MPGAIINTNLPVTTRRQPQKFRVSGKTIAPRETVAPKTLTILLTPVSACSDRFVITLPATNARREALRFGYTSQGMNRTCLGSVTQILIRSSLRRRATQRRPTLERHGIGKRYDCYQIGFNRDGESEESCSRLSCWYPSRMQAAREHLISA